MRLLPPAIAAGLALALPLHAQEPPVPAPSPGEIVAAAPTGDWIAIAPSDLLVMSLAPDRDGNRREIVIQLMPPPFSQGWIGNIRKLAAAHWWDGTSVNRVQDNYVVQWGDAEAEDKAKAKAVPAKLEAVHEREYTVPIERIYPVGQARNGDGPADAEVLEAEMRVAAMNPVLRDSYAASAVHMKGWPVAGDYDRYWPVHCYGMVGVGRDLAPDTGSGAELYTVIGHAPRHLDRNIALVGRVIEGIENLSSLPRGTLPLGFYDVAKGEKRVPIVAIRLASELPAAQQPRFEYLSTESASFARYADARANRRDPFFNVPAGGADICNIPVPVRRIRAEK